MKCLYLCALVISVVSTSAHGQKVDLSPAARVSTPIQDVLTSNVPTGVTRNILQDKHGNIWIASFQGVFKYDANQPAGQVPSFTNATNGVSSARFFSALEDEKGNLWFGSIGSGVYRYDGVSFQNFTTKEGLLNNEVTSIYEDKTGNIWFGVNGGISRYDGRSFRNFMMVENSITEDRTGKTLPDVRPPHEINSMIEDKSGKVWLGTRENTFTYDGKTFTPVTHDGQPFLNVRSLLKDKNGNIWLGGASGLWRYDGTTFTNIQQNFVGYIYQDKLGNIWTSAQEANENTWALSRYDEKSLYSAKPRATGIKPNSGMVFGITEANDGSIWFGADGVYRFDGYSITHYKNK